MSTRKRLTTYKGALAKPLRPISDRAYFLAALRGEARPEAAIVAQAKELSRRFNLLFDHYEIGARSKTVEKMTELAVRLAADHVPGLQVMKAPPGRKLKWTSDDRAQLQAALAAEMAGPTRKSKSQAAKILVKREPWSRLAKSASSLLRLTYATARTAAFNHDEESDFITLGALGLGPIK